MQFNSFHFLLFFTIVVVLFFSVPQRWRTILLLAASYYFYACWKLEYIILIWISTLVDYVAGMRLDRCSHPGWRRVWLLVSLLVNLGILAGFKYFNFFNDSIRQAFDAYNIVYAIPNLNVLLPVGISFYTFQTLSYTIEVYRGRQQAETSLSRFALYVAFFPQLVAGPIERSISLLPQLARFPNFNYTRVCDGLQLMLWGFFKKLVIADRCAVLVNEIYAAPARFNGFALLFATYLFAFQIYCDFSGYTDIARGAAKVFGVELMRNFRRPYFAASIGEFWQRWHISLSTWFRDYLYIPLGGNRVSRQRWCINIMIVFLVSGLWHGANWTFLLWGLLHGIYMLVEAVVRVHSAKQHWVSMLLHCLRIVFTFHLVVISWVFFRAASIRDAWLILRRVASPWAYQWEIMVFDRQPVEVYLAICGIVFLLCMQILNSRISLQSWLHNRPLPVRWTIWIGGILAIILLGKYEELVFIYFQF